MGLPFVKTAIAQLFSKPSTELYPFVEKEAADNYRGKIMFHADKCISCGMCERVCSGGAISTNAVDTEEGQLITRTFFLGACTFCGHCADFCAKNAIELTKNYHMVARQESDLIVQGTYLKKKPQKAVPPPKPAEKAAQAADRAKPEIPPKADVSEEKAEKGVIVNESCVIVGEDIKKELNDVEKAVSKPTLKGSETSESFDQNSRAAVDPEEKPLPECKAD